MSRCNTTTVQIPVQGLEGWHAAPLPRSMHGFSLSLCFSVSLSAQLLVLLTYYSRDTLIDNNNNKILHSCIVHSVILYVLLLQWVVINWVLRILCGGPQAFSITSLAVIAIFLLCADLLSRANWCKVDVLLFLVHGGCPPLPRPSSPPSWSAPWSSFPSSVTPSSLDSSS
jgi:hypothetical protein